MGFEGQEAVYQMQRECKSSQVEEKLRLKSRGKDEAGQVGE